MSQVQAFFIALLIIFALPYLLWRVLALEAWAPLAIVQIIGGVVLGPGVAGALAPEAQKAIFSPPTIAMLSGIANWSVVAFVFLAGCELELKAAWNARRDALTTAGLALIFPFMFGLAAAALLLNSPGTWKGELAANWQAALGTGMACAVTALPILVLLLQRLEILRSPLGQRTIRYASLDDIAIWGVLAAILLDWQRLGAQAAYLAAFLILFPIYRTTMSRLNNFDRWALALLWLVGNAFAADYCALHFTVGAFLAGAVTERSWFEERRFEEFRETLLMAFMPVFFLSTGLKTTWHMGGWAIFGSATLLLVASVSGKLVGVHLAGYALRWPKGEAWRVGWLLQTKALIMIIFANILLDRQIIAPDLFTAMLLMAVASTALTMPAWRIMSGKGLPDMKKTAP